MRKALEIKRRQACENKKAEAVDTVSAFSPIAFSLGEGYETEKMRFTVVVRYGWAQISRLWAWTRPCCSKTSFPCCYCRKNFSPV